MKLITLIIFLNIGLFKVNSCDCCNENKSSGSGSSSQKPPKQIDNSGKTIEKLEPLLVINEAPGLGNDNVEAFRTFLNDDKSNLEGVLDGFSRQKKIRVFYNFRGDESTDVIIFVSSDVVPSLGLDTNNNKLHRLNNQIYYFYYLFFNNNGYIMIENKDSVFAKLDISKLKWKD